MARPHDRLFQKVFSDPEQAAGELQVLLPSEISRHIDWSTLRSERTVFINEKLAERRSDVLFSAQLEGHPVLLYLLLEHKSTSARLVALDLLRYMVWQWDDWLGKNPAADHLPVIIPMVVHHSERGWSAPLCFEEILDVPTDALAILRPHLPGFQYLLDDLSAERDEALRRRVLIPALGKLALLLLKWSRESPDILTDLRRNEDLVKAVIKAPNGVTAMATAWSYILEATEVSHEAAARLAQELGPKTEEAFMTGAQVLEARGEARGIAKGKAEGQRQLLELQIKQRFQSLPDEARKRLEHADEVQLTLWAERILDATTLDDVFG